MRTVTATEASPSFAALLDEVGRGETVFVTRGGRRTAAIGPATSGNGADVLELLRSSTMDDGFADDCKRNPSRRRRESRRMARRLILDTGVLINTERSRIALSSVIDPDDDVALAAISVAELRAAVELADERHRAGGSALVDRVLELIPVELSELSTATRHGQLFAHVRRSGQPRGAHDLIIAATAIATRRTLVTTDGAAKFDELPGVDCVVCRYRPEVVGSSYLDCRWAMQPLPV